MCTIEVVLSNWLVRSINNDFLRCPTPTFRVMSIVVIITDQEYPVRPAFSLLTKVVDDFIAKVPQASFANPGAISFPDLNNYLQKYQDPRQADAIMRVQQELDETKIILVGTLTLFTWYHVACAHKRVIYTA